MRDIESKKDIEKLVDKFYNKVLKNDTLSPFFESLNFENHLPKMVHFWSFILLDESGYTTDVTAKHINMQLKKGDFDEWIKLFNESVDELFEGENAKKAKQRAFLMRWTMESKIKHDE